MFILLFIDQCAKDSFSVLQDKNSCFQFKDGYPEASCQSIVVCFLKYF